MHKLRPVKEDGKNWQKFFKHRNNYSPPNITEDDFAKCINIVEKLGPEKK